MGKEMIATGRPKKDPRRGAAMVLFALIVFVLFDNTGAVKV